MKKQQTDVLIIGSGIAGLSFAIQLAEKVPDLRIHILTKTDPSECNTRYAQGGIAAVTGHQDTFSRHIHDTLIAGDGLCNDEIVHMVVQEGPARLEDLVNWGVRFDRSENNLLDLALEGGHSRHRVAHRGDYTGLEIETVLLNKALEFPNIVMASHYFVLDLVIANAGSEAENQKICKGAYVTNLHDSEKIIFHARITYLASGGVGRLFENTTNPPVATGDGIAMAKRAGARISNMEFLQFHPTAMLLKKEKKYFLISEAVRGAGAKLRNSNGDLFMHHYDSRAELAPRDIVCRSIVAELERQGGEKVYLDCTMIRAEDFRQKFPVIHQKCAENGIDPSRDLIPVMPAMHYLCGGIDTDPNGRTNIHSLYAGGECANTGLHGANRLASNSLLEALVFSHRSAIQVSQELKEKDQHTSYRFSDRTFLFPEKDLASRMMSRLQKIMSGVAIISSSQKLHLAAEQIARLKSAISTNGDPTFSKEGAEFMNLLAVAQLVISHSINRKSNKGGFYNADLVKQPRMI